MEKIALRCDVCDGPLTMQSGGQMAVCEYCGTRYALERLREKVQEIRGKVTVEGVVKTASADFEIRAGVLVKYHGQDTEIVIPQGVVKEIGPVCFKDCKYITSVVLPDGLQKISGGAFYGGAFSGCQSLKKINIPDSVTSIGNWAFSECSSLETINIPDSVDSIGGYAFYLCTNLKNVIISDETFKRHCPRISEDRRNYHYSWKWLAFWSGEIYSDRGWLGIQQGDDRYNIEKLDEKLKSASPWFREVVMQKLSQIEDLNDEHDEWMFNYRCQYCGGRFKGIFDKRCEDCGHLKDY